MPLPPYIHPDDGSARRVLDRARYQTVYASEPGAVAAPTAGLHFTPELLDALLGSAIETAFLTLAVGPGTFRPVTVERVEDHVMDAESYRIPAATADAVNRALRQGRRVVAVGTTTVRALEHAAAAVDDSSREDDRPELVATVDRADIFISPGYRFRVVGAMITNLHLPRSTPILLAAAMVGRQRLLAAYAEAVESGYRFYSYGDAMLLQ
jgi:S-adenosylmethionine:tRNA ribosyltransferase-isomerase